MAQRVGVSKDTVARVWAARGLKPHLVDTFKLSNDPAFEDKLIDVVGLYMNPPDNAIVLCMDEKAQRPCAATPPAHHHAEINYAVTPVQKHTELTSGRAPHSRHRKRLGLAALPTRH